MQSSKQWWLKARNSPKRSTGLQSTIRELDEKTVAMLRIIEQDADSFAQRADMYYKKRPQLISMVEDLYRSHRSLAEKLYAAKLEPWSHATLIGANVACFESKLDYDTYTESLDSDPYTTESEVDDPETDDETSSQETMKLREEIERLRAENRAQQVELARKDEEKREVIRQLSLAVDMMKEENQMLKKSSQAKDSGTNKRWNFPEFRKVFFSIS